MQKTISVITIILMLIIFTGCGLVATSTTPDTPTPVPTPTFTPLPTETALPTETPEPTATPPPTVTPFPTPAEVAPERTFARVGDVAHLAGTHDVAAKAIVAGLQTLIIQRFNYDGKGPQPDIRLVKGDDYENPAVVLVELEARVYKDEFFLVHIPSSVGPGTADSIAVYSTDENTAYAVATFE